MESVLNRYYDPTTDQFMSVDPDVATTHQPYVFTNDNPLNATDPLGLKGSPGDQCMGRSDAGSCDKAVLKSVEKAAAAPLTWKTGVAVIVNVGGIFGADETGLGEGADLAVDSWAADGAASDAASSTGLSASPNFEDASQAPEEGFEWRGNGPVGSSEGSWYNANTQESLHPDLSHPEPIGPHYDYKSPNGDQYRVYPDGRVLPK